MLDAGLDLGCLGRRIAEGVDEPLHLVAEAILIALGGEKILVALDTFLHVVVEAAVVAGDGFSIDLDRHVGQRPQEIAIMGDQEERAFKFAQEALHPLDGGKVEIVGRLIEHEQIWFRDEGADEFGTHLPATTEFAERTVEVLGMKSQSAQSFLDP